MFEVKYFKNKIVKIKSAKMINKNLTSTLKKDYHPLDIFIYHFIKFKRQQKNYLTHL